MVGRHPGGRGHAEPRDRFSRAEPRRHRRTRLTTGGARLALEDGRCFQGVACGADGVTSGEVVFNTSMTGYQEILTDPSYAGQIVTMTCPEMGNYGTRRSTPSRGGPRVAGFVVREVSPVASNWRARATLQEYLASHGIVAHRGHRHPGADPPAALVRGDARRDRDRRLIVERAGGARAADAPDGGRGPGRAR